MPNGSDRMPERAPIIASLRLRLLVGAAAIATVAVIAAGLAAYGVAEAARMIERSAAAQNRIDMLSALSARVSDYALVVVETAEETVPAQSRTARRQSAAEAVKTAFGVLGRALERDVADVAMDGETEQMRRATKSLGLARMQAQFGALARNVDAAADSANMRANLDGFATQFSPLLNAAVNEEIRDRDAARHTVTDLRDRMVLRAFAAALVAALLVVLFYLFLVRPLLNQLGSLRDAAIRIGAGQFDVALPDTGRTEMGLLMREVNATATALRTRQDEVNADRAQLNQIIEDRTARLEEANARLSSIDGERRRFFADVGHELRTPLTVILAESELGQTGEPDVAMTTEALSVIHSRAKRLNRRIDDLLRVARSETGQIELQPMSFDLAEAAQAACMDLMPLARRRGVALEMTLEPAPAHGDPDWCRQVISGLIENALKHSPDGATIEVTSQPTGSSAIASVIDEGPGIPASELDGITSRFARGSREAAGSGFGVGLALARWVAEQQSGSLKLESPAPRPPRSGKTGQPGVEVTFSLPVSPEKSQS